MKILPYADAKKIIELSALVKIDAIAIVSLYI